MFNRGILKSHRSNNTTWFSKSTKLITSYLHSNCVKYQYSRRQELKQRLHFQYEYVKSVHGFSYAWTLTYNELSLPKFLGINSHHYPDLRKFFKSLNMWAQRYYGFRLEYAVFCELGEGKGVRGLDCNPHFHILCFFIPLDSSNKNFKNLFYVDGLPVFADHKTVYDMARYYWQGGKYCKDSLGRPHYFPRYDWKMAKYGSISYSKKKSAGPYGFVTSEAALSYAAKYALKDVLKQSHIDLVCKSIEEYINSRKDQILNEYVLKYPQLKVDDPELLDETLESYWLWYSYNAFLSVYRFFVSNYSTKVRLSKGLGHFEFASKFIEDGSFLMPDYTGAVVVTPLRGYFFRKLFYNVVKEFNDDYVLTNYYRPSVDYVKFRISKYDVLLDAYKKVFTDTVQLFSTDLYYSFVHYLDVNNIVLTPEMSDFVQNGFEKLDYLLEDSDLIYKYAIYMLVYQGRPCSDFLSRLDPFEDFKTFLNDDYNSQHYLNYCPNDISTDYSLHCDFVGYVGCFNVVSLLHEFAQFTDYCQYADREYFETQETIKLNSYLYE